MPPGVGEQQRRVALQQARQQLSLLICVARRGPGGLGGHVRPNRTPRVRQFGRPPPRPPSAKARPPPTLWALSSSLPPEETGERASRASVVSLRLWLTWSNAISPLPDNTKPDSVGWITASALGMLADQQRRAESLQTRAAQVAGFAGAAVALGAPLARAALGHLDGCDQLLAAIFYFGSVGTLSLTIVLSIVFVLIPVRHYAIPASEIGHYINDPRFVTQPPPEIQFRTLKSIRPAVVRYEEVNGTKAFWLKIAAVLFLVGLLLTVAVAVTLAADRL